MRALGVVNEHVEDIAVSPVRDALAALLLDCLMNRSNSIERSRGGPLIGEDDVLRVARRREEPANGIAWQLTREEQPIDRAIQRELGGTAGEDKEHHVSVTPNPPHDGMSPHEISHMTPERNPFLKLDTVHRARAAGDSVEHGS